MSEPETVLSPDQLRAVASLAGADGSESEGADAAGRDPETTAGWLAESPKFIATLNRAKTVRRHDHGHDHCSHPSCPRHKFARWFFPP